MRPPYFTQRPVCPKRYHFASRYRHSSAYFSNPIEQCPLDPCSLSVCYDLAIFTAMAWPCSSNLFTLVALDASL
jgi:hypothetical protein